MEDVKTELRKAVRAVKACARYQAELGVEGFDSPAKLKPAVGALEKDAVFETSLLTLDDVRAEIGDCKRCELHKSRTQIVFGVGSPNAELMFIGEAPGEDEDRQGIPFVGRAGQLLTKIIVAMKYTREEVYIANVNKCRPPKNRDPKPDEVEACEPFLIKQIQAIKPKAIVALGKWAAQTLLKTDVTISALRGNFRDYHGIPLMPTFHPAAILRNSSYRRPVWEDMQKVMQMFGKAP